MKKYFYVMFCVLSCLILFSYNSNDAKLSVPAGIGDLAPAFSLQDIAGSTVNLSEYKNKVILIEFWATWCPPCKASVPELIEVQKKYEAREFTVLGVSVDRAQDLSNYLTEFSRAYHINYPVLIGNDDVARKYNVTSIPVSVLIDKKGKIVNIYVGYSANFAEKISAQIEKII